jgi:ribosome-associated protein
MVAAPVEQPGRASWTELVPHEPGRRITSDGVIVITAARFRSQLRNREDARERLVALVRQAAEPPAPRHKTKPPRGSKIQRREAKRHRSAVKSLRRVKIADE